MKQRFEFAILSTLAGYLLYAISGDTDTLLLVLSCLVPVIGWGAIFLPLDSDPRPSTFQVERAYLIRVKQAFYLPNGERRGPGYPMTVNREALEKALAATDEYGQPAYEYEGPATANEAGDMYVNDGTGGTGSYVPGGYMVVEKAEYLDERLN